ncbi:hypothetical protein [Saccharopolyspora hattusasensis]|uniref:hypothetical protein n=1 Tax=Saccharopolyspora hattusasensis TaxID=1128679 RepID=UPI003D987AAF
MPYRVLVGHLRSGRVVAELPGEYTFEDTLDGAGSGRATIPIDAVPEVLDLAAVTEKWRHFLAIVRGGHVVWAGPIVTRKPNANGSLEVGASGLAAVFEHRVLARFGPWEFTDPRADVILTGRSLRSIAVEIVRTALNRPHGELPIVLPDMDPTGGEERRYFGHELAMAGQRLQQLSKEENGPEVQFTPRFRADGLGVEWVMRVGDPYLTQAGARWHFDHGAGLVSWNWDDDGQNQASSVFVPGDGTERGRLIGHAQDDHLLDAGWPPLDTVVSDFASVKDPAVLSNHARASLTAYRAGVHKDTAVVRGDHPPTPGTYRPGDLVVLLPRPSRLTPAGPRVRRITGISRQGGGSEDTLELTLAPIPT